jgi:DNA modification methylase
MSPRMTQKPSDSSKQRRWTTIPLRVPVKELKMLQAEVERGGFEDISEYLLSLHQANLPVPPPKRKRGRPKKPVVPKSIFETQLGQILHGDSTVLMRSIVEPESIDLVLTSPPFPLNTKKDYGNEDVDRYWEWLRPFVEGIIRVLKPDGSLVIDLGGVWKKGLPIRSLYHYEVLINLCREYGFHLAQEFYWWNPSKLPTPAEWVNVRRVRVKDAVNCIWWLSRTPFPKASNRRVLQPYSSSQHDLMRDGYRSKMRPSGHNISNKFGKDNKGAIPPNLLALANTDSNGDYQRYCREKGLPEHPARFPIGIPAFFLHMMTDPGDIVLDPFAGSCVTGEACERMGRKWICCELDESYTQGALGRFLETDLFPSSLEPSREKPYEIFPPNSLPAEKLGVVPLIADGGEKRPKELQGKPE